MPDFNKESFEKNLKKMKELSKENLKAQEKYEERQTAQRKILIENIEFWLTSGLELAVSSKEEFNKMCHFDKNDKHPYFLWTSQYFQNGCERIVIDEKLDTFNKGYDFRPLMAMHVSEACDNINKKYGKEIFSVDTSTWFSCNHIERNTVSIYVLI